MASFSQPVVIDNGSGVVKAGFAGEEAPKTFFPAIIGKPKHHRVMGGGKLEGDYFIGPKAEEYRGLLKIRYPVEHGVVTNWEDMEKIWNYVYSEELKARPEEHPVLLTEPALNPKRNKDEAAKVLFETYNVPACYFAIQAVLSLYSSGRTTGIVLDSGDGVTHTVPVFEGFAIESGIRRVDVAGRDVTDYMQLLLRKAGYRFTTTAEKEIVRTLKEKVCLVAPKKPSKEDKQMVDYVLPDGSVVKLGPERSMAPEILFNPEMIGDESSGAPALLYESIMKVDIDLRKDLFSNIYLAGGSTLFKGYGERMLSELKELLPKEAKNSKIKIYAPPERKYSAWIGGSILANLTSFKKVWISAAEYKEDPDIIHKKAF